MADTQCPRCGATELNPRTQCGMCAAFLSSSHVAGSVDDIPPVAPAVATLSPSPQPETAQPQPDAIAPQRASVTDAPAIPAAMTCSRGWSVREREQPHEAEPATTEPASVAAPPQGQRSATQLILRGLIALAALGAIAVVVLSVRAIVWGR